MSREIILTRGKVAIVDDDDYAVLAQHKWHYTTKGCAARRLSVWEGGNIVLMHRVILRLKGSAQGDHINRDKLDNRKINLRIATNGQNQANQSLGRNNTTGYKGVTKPRRVPGYVAQIRHNNATIFIGYFRDPKQAAQAYNKIAKDLFGEFAYINPIEED